jgi:hypothetical protein
MATLEAVLQSLDPPVKYDLMREGDKISLQLFDPSASAFAQRTLFGGELKNHTQFRVIVLYALNELRRQGSHVPLDVLPDWND